MSKHTGRWARRLGGDGFDIGCERCFAELDVYVELELDGVDADAKVPGMRAHLDGCPACLEEHDTLLTIVARDDLPDVPHP